mmetsp:Transcript_43312/g.86060  ORF Transcript_43312/g.86060 Transcript_43312/m.86060 type:complete len:296 (+) Transcript_43312:1313-2200(+)
MGFTEAAGNAWTTSFVASFVTTTFVRSEKLLNISSGILPARRCKMVLHAWQTVFKAPGSSPRSSAMRFIFSVASCMPAANSVIMGKTLRYCCQRASYHGDPAIEAPTVPRSDFAPLSRAFSTNSKSCTISGSKGKSVNASSARHTTKTSPVNATAAQGSSHKSCASKRTCNNLQAWASTSAFDSPPAMSGVRKRPKTMRRNVSHDTAMDQPIVLNEGLVGSKASDSPGESYHGKAMPIKPETSPSLIASVKRWSSSAAETSGANEAPAATTHATAALSSRGIIFAMLRGRSWSAH